MKLIESLFSMKIGFAIIPEESFLSQIIELENEYNKKLQFKHSLGLSKNLPHITLFQGEFPEDLNYIEIVHLLYEKIKGFHKPLNVEFKKIEYIEKGWFFLVCNKTDSLTLLHLYLLEYLSKYVILPKDRLDNKEREHLTNLQYEAIVKYNYRYAGDAFFPHITIGRSLKNNDVVLKEINNDFMKLNNFSKISRVTAYKMGDDGVHEETLYEQSF